MSHIKCGFFTCSKLLLSDKIGVRLKTFTLFTVMQYLTLFRLYANLMCCAQYSHPVREKCDHSRTQLAYRYL